MGVGTRNYQIHAQLTAIGKQPTKQSRKCLTAFHLPLGFLFKVPQITLISVSAFWVK